MVTEAAEVVVMVPRGDMAMTEAVARRLALRQTLPSRQVPEVAPRPQEV